MKYLNEPIIESSGNVFKDLGLPPEEAEVLALRAGLLNELRKAVFDTDWTPKETARRLLISEARVSDLLQGKHETFSLELLVTLAVRLGKRCELHLAA